MCWPKSFVSLYFWYNIFGHLKQESDFSWTHKVNWINYLIFVSSSMPSMWHLVPICYIVSTDLFRNSSHFIGLFQKRSFFKEWLHSNANADKFKLIWHDRNAKKKINEFIYSALFKLKTLTLKKKRSKKMDQSRVAKWNFNVRKLWSKYFDASSPNVNTSTNTHTNECCCALVRPN